ncbi:serine/threonine protein kinase [uncultured Microbacterium sp.]|uniref:serine/threonine protein kinase n=1 Tax=uncultured Microbacterium sp. TaxID=191216 RepID=UPI0035CC55A2
MTDAADGLIAGRYALGELLGVGGTGSVFAAIDVGAPHPGKSVAVKLLHPHLCVDEASRVAFLREAEHVMALHHPNVVRVRGAGLHDAAGVTMPWIALDLLNGPTLREWVDATGRLSPADAVAVAEGMLSALAAAHAAGIIHRDISPQNIVLDGVGDRAAGAPLAPDMVRLLDFGLADITGRSTIGVDVLLAGSSEEWVPTGAGVVGNAAFMSPEQAQGLAVRAVSDLYQAGAVLYFALTGRAPFPRATTEQVLQAHVAAPPPVPSALAPAARPLDRLVTRAMAKTPAHRFRDAGEFLTAVQAAAVPVAGEASASGAGARGGANLAAGEPRSTQATRIFASAGEVSDLGYLSPAPVGEVAPTVARSGTGLAVGVAGAVILALAGWAAVASATTPASPAPAPTSATSESASAPPSDAPVASAAPPAPAESAPPTPEAVVIPALYGSLADAEAALRGAGLVLGTVTRIESAEAADRVLSQHPSAGQSVGVGDSVTVTIASGNNVVPQVSGMSYAAAAALIESAGFAVAADRTASAGSTVSVSQPGAGTVLRVGVTVALALSAPSTPSPRPTTPSPGPTEETP